MSLFPQADSTNERQHRRELASGVSAALRGETYNVGGIVTFAQGTTSTTLTDVRFGSQRTAFLIPRCPNASQVRWHLSSITNGTATFTYPNIAQPCQFNWVVVGVNIP